MKILELRFKNLNSLYGEWCIDFADPEYAANGIFALTGPTGAGKSTLLDAICLALYGTTPRLGRITKSANEILSRQTGECYAEVVFESQAGRFRCHWEQRRARKRPEGNLQDPEHQIADADSGKILESKKSRVGAVIEAKTGMDFDRFTRSILLAQGGFDTFLRADIEQKSRILEQITGTEIYSQISRHVHERLRDEREKLSTQQAEISGIALLETEMEASMRQDLAVWQKEDEQLTEKLDQTRAGVLWLTGLETLEKEIDELKKALKKGHDAILEFKPERQRLERADEAALLDGLHARLDATRRQLQSDEKRLCQEQDVLPDLVSEAEKHEGKRREAGEKAQQARQAKEKASPTLQKTRLLDHSLEALQKNIEQQEVLAGETQKKLNDAKATLKKVEGSEQQLQKEHGDIRAYYQSHAKDEALAGEFAGIEARLMQHESELTKIVLLANELEEERHTLTRIEAKLESAMKIKDGQAESLGQLETLEKEKNRELEVCLGSKRLQEYRSEKEHLLREMALLKKVEALEDARAKLEGGKPCPLCGSLEHPYAKGNAPAADETEQKIEALTKKIEQAEKLEGGLQDLRQGMAKAKEALTQAQHDLKAIQTQKETIRSSCKKQEGKIQEAQEATQQQESKILCLLKPYGIEDISKGQIETALTTLRQRKNAYQEKEKQEQALREKLSRCQEQRSGLAARMDELTQSRSEREKAIDHLKKDHAQKALERQDVFGEKDPDEEAKRLDKAIQKAEKAEKEAAEQAQEWQKKLSETRSICRDLEGRIQKQAPKLKTIQGQFESQLAQTGFESEDDYWKARLDPQTRQKLASRAKQLDEQEAAIRTRLLDRKDRLQKETAKNLTAERLQDLKPKQKAFEEDLKSLTEKMASAKQKLEDNDRARERIAEKKKLVEEQQETCRQWGQLHTLIGSADGKKYRNFAQGLTFELMILHANRQLGKMSDRYLLTRDPQQPLELNVIDNYQAGEVRSTKNLSGGESFLVSLSLALGLSRMASQKVRVDSLFLDEGFGTLDEDALETALEALSGLKQDGKLIGVISHVSALKERIFTQIRIQPLSGGRSQLSGPGCQKLKGES